jgi:hypothetical protein
MTRSQLSRMKSKARCQSYKTFFSSLMERQNKLECFCSKSFSEIVYYLGDRLGDFCSRKFYTCLQKILELIFLLCQQHRKNFNN